MVLVMAGTAESPTSVLVRERTDRGLSMRAAALEMDVSLDTLRRAEAGAAPSPGRPGGLGEAAAKKIAGYYGFKPSELWPIRAGQTTNPSKEAA